MAKRKTSDSRVRRRVAIERTLDRSERAMRNEMLCLVSFLESCIRCVMTVGEVIEWDTKQLLLRFYNSGMTIIRLYYVCILFH